MPPRDLPTRAIHGCLHGVVRGIEVGFQAADAVEAGVVLVRGLWTAARNGSANRDS